MADLKARIEDSSLTPFERLCLVMEILRSPEGCAWDRAQDHKSLLPYLIEETYEVAEAIEAGDPGALKEELGDLLCQIVFHAQLASEQEAFDVQDSVNSIVDKLIHRHPHVFGERKDLAPSQVRDQWEKIKTESGEKDSVLGGVPSSMPALTMAFRMGEKAAGVGFDWNRPEEVIDKINEELNEIDEARGGESSGRQERLTDEIGDLLFAVASLSRKLQVDPETALRQALQKFRRRFAEMERRVTNNGGRFDDHSLDSLEAIWQLVKGETDDA
ncbi:MAG: nucleoside triphosphate pyrophosphohydrolase [bacterium]|nr:nucleoside triphosphate pyrophosphohydrolase [bacterium]